MAKLYANKATSAPSGAIADTDTTISLVDASRFPSPSGDFFDVVIEEGSTFEYCRVGGKSTNDLTSVTRAQYGTTALDFTTAAVVSLVSVADDFERKVETGTLADNELTRSDGTGKLLQASGVFVSDTQNVTGVNDLTLGGGATTAQLKFLEGSASGTNVLTIQAPATLGADKNFTLPDDYPAGNGYSLVCSTAGVFSFSNVSGGGGGGSPGGSDTQVQYNSGGSFAGHSGFTYNGAGVATLNVGVIAGGNSTASGYLRLMEDSDNGTNYFQISAAASMSANNTYTAPSAYPGTNGFVLSCTTAGVMSWVSALPSNTIANGLTGRTSNTAYSIMFAGTTSTSAMQQLTPGATNTILSSGGTGALPSWTANPTLNNVTTNDLIVGGQLSFAKSEKWVGEIPVNLPSSPVHDWSFGGEDYRIWMISNPSGASSDLTGIDFSGSYSNVVTLVNVSANNIVLKANNAGSAATNRFYIPQDITLTQNASVTLFRSNNVVPYGWYDVASKTASGGGGGSKPYFLAERSTTQAITSNTLTKVAFNTATMDTASVFNTSNNRYVASTAGNFNVAVGLELLVTTGTTGTLTVHLYKNGAAHRTFRLSQAFVSGGAYSINFVAPVNVNGSTDYLEVYVLCNTSALTVTTASYLAGVLL